VSVQAKSHPLPIAPERASLATLVPCARGSGCPLGVDVPALANAALRGDHAAAYRIARGANPFASSCGIGCHAPCESACHRRTWGAPVAIAALEWAAASGSVPALAAADIPCTSAHDARSVAGLVGRTPEQAVRARRSGKRVAVVGAGVTGLACAHDLALLGHHCVVFDAAREPGGVLTHAIPGFRFSIASARAECAAILAMGVELQSDYRIESSADLRALLAGEFDAVFLALGASEPRESLFPDQPEHPDVVDAMHVLARPAAYTGRTVVIGDGELALDVARTLRRLAPHGGSSAASIHVVLETPLEESTLPGSMVAAALQEGIDVRAGWSAARYFTQDAQVLSGVELTRRAARVSSILACDRVVTAARRTAPAAVFRPDVDLDGLGFIQVDPETLQTSMSRVWAGGACAYGHRAIANAAADGKRAAWHIHGALTRQPVRIAVTALWVEAEDRDAGHADRALATPRALLPNVVTPPADPFAMRELGADVRREASRCLDCTVAPVISDACTSCGQCTRGCPTSALTLVPGATPAIRLDPARCTRCGVCVQLCPESAIAMQRAVWEERLTAVPDPAALPVPARARFATPVG
jgi:NADPH-dependent glutamate synthase beta subunit-like oxidoreductase/ferredoxin